LVSIFHKFYFPPENNSSSLERSILPYLSISHLWL
jgi:hypothetical protein